MKIRVEVHKDSAHYKQPYCKQRGNATPIDTVGMHEDEGEHGVCYGNFSGMYKGHPKSEMFFHKLILTETGRKRLDRWIKEHQDA